MQLILFPHPSTPPADPLFKVWATVDHVASLSSVATTNIWFGVGAPAERFVIPEAEEPGRADELWKTTCFEAFLQPAGGHNYREWNFAPSGDWAAYDFSGYREDMAEAEVAEPYIRAEDNFTWWALGATITAAADQQWQLGLSAVLEEKNGSKSYWALAHPNSDKPDFHATDCFAAKLA
ncbi:MAG TPA: DOMON-like domain-containing protein [Sphingomicrobium sp.]|nr:DOMON-like domain-containing protein [Sphingomicrobium sp.]